MSAGYYDAYYKKAQRVRRLMKDDFTRAFADVDVILSPTTPTTAFALNSQHDNPCELYQADIFTLAVNLAGLPALSMPAGFAGGLPVGCQLIAPHFEESRIIQLGHQYQQLTDWHRHSPSTMNNSKESHS